MCTVFLDRAGSCEGTQLERGMCRLACFHWNVACIVSQTINSSFSRPSSSKPLRSKPKSCSWIHVQSGRRDHSGGHREETALRLQECMNELHRSRMSFQQALFLWGSSSVWICVLLWWIIKKRTQWMLSCSEDETLIWWKETAPQWNHVWQLEDNLLK